MNRWLASRWMIISVTLSGAALGLSVWLEDASVFTAVATATIALGQAKNIFDARSNNPTKGE